MAIKELIEEAIPLIQAELEAAQAFADSPGDEKRAAYVEARKAVEAHEVARRMYKAACFPRWVPEAETSSKPEPASGDDGNGGSVSLALRDFRKLVTDLESARNLLVSAGDHGKRLVEVIDRADKLIGASGSGQEIAGIEPGYRQAYGAAEQAGSLRFFGSSEP